MEINETLDLKGLSCPMPMMKTAKAVKNLKSDEIIKVLTTDPGSKTDIPKWVEKNGHSLIEENEEDSAFVFIIQKK
ncbi:MAG: sulfurtransferase TusA family protein [Bacteroidota bacterium]|nr:sulfurtransferase TusA family protein [Bacteroidota bacterium]